MPYYNRANVRNVTAPCAWSAKHYYEKTHCCNDDSRDKILHFTTVLAYYTFDDYWTCSVLVKIYKNIWGGVIPPYIPLNMADVPNAGTPRAWSADFYDLSRNAYTATVTCGSKFYILLLRTTLYFNDCKAWTVLVQTYKNFSGGGFELPHSPP